MGLPAELGLEGQQANIALCIFFVPYIIFEVPSNVLMKKLNPHVWLAACILIFGIIMIAQGFVKSYSGLLATRFFLGLAEAGIFPGSFYLISFWYKKEESQKRFTVYWSSTILAGAFGGLLASAIGNMGGIRGLSSWRWVFILEGIATVLIGILAFFCITDFPREAKWLTPEERIFVLNKIKNDESRGVPVTTKDVFAFLGTAKAWFGAIMYFCESIRRVLGERTDTDPKQLFWLLHIRFLILHQQLFKRSATARSRLSCIRSRHLQQPLASLSS